MCGAEISIVNKACEQRSVSLTLTRCVNGRKETDITNSLFKRK